MIKGTHIQNFIIECIPTVSSDVEQQQSPTNSNNKQKKRAFDLVKMRCISIILRNSCNNNKMMVSIECLDEVRTHRSTVCVQHTHTHTHINTCKDETAAKQNEVEASESENSLTSTVFAVCVRFVVVVWSEALFWPKSIRVFSPSKFSVQSFIMYKVYVSIRFSQIVGLNFSILFAYLSVLCAWVV